MLPLAGFLEQDFLPFDLDDRDVPQFAGAPHDRAQMLELDIDRAVR
jgi:hypothetical protein